MNQERYIAALEISSSKILGAVARVAPSGLLEIMAAEQEKSSEGVRYGVIRNLEDTAMRVARVIEKLERNVVLGGRKITGVFIGMSGRSLRSVSKEVSLKLPAETEITDDILTRLQEQARHAPVDSSLEVVDALPRTFLVDGIEMRQPKGNLASTISATYDLIVCRPELRRNIERTVGEKLGLRIDGIVVTAMAASRLVLTDEDRRPGCMLVDLGAETTTTSIYKDGHLRYFATLPLGSRHITRDLTTLNILEERAEDIKTNSGNAMPSEGERSINIHGLKNGDINAVIVARAEEIAANILEQPSYAGLNLSQLPAGIICIGGGFKLNNMTQVVGRDIRTRAGQLPATVRIETARVPTVDLIGVAAVLQAGALETDKECLELPDRQGLPEIGNAPEAEMGEQTETPRKSNRKKEGIGKKVGRWFAGMFAPADEDDDSDLTE